MWAQNNLWACVGIFVRGLMKLRPKNLYLNNVSNAFLHDILEEDVYMHQPPGYVDSLHPSYVCKLHKSLYGLKQAPRAWFERFIFHLLHLGFIVSLADNSLFIFQYSSTIIYLLLYVDDIIVIGNNSS